MPLYAIVALLGFGVTYAVFALSPSHINNARDIKLDLVATLASAFVDGVVLIGVTARDSGTARSWASTIDRALQVLWAIVVVDVCIAAVSFAIEKASEAAVLSGSIDANTLAFFQIPVMLIMTCLSFAEAAAAIDDDAPGGRLLNALRNGLGSAFRFENFGRIILVTAVTALPQSFLGDMVAAIVLQLHGPHATAWTAAEKFWIAYPLDFATTGVVAAIVGVVYREMRLRAKAAS